METRFGDKLLGISIGFILFCSKGVKGIPPSLREYFLAIEARVLYAGDFLPSSSLVEGRSQPEKKNAP